MRQPGFRPAYLATRDSVARRVRQAGMILVTIGISLDWDPAVGFNLLRPYGPFDEVAVGANWENIGAVDYIWNDKGVAAIPQVVVLERFVNHDGRVIAYGADHVMLRLIGMSDLQAWTRAGGKLSLKMDSGTTE